MLLKIYSVVRQVSLSASGRFRPSLLFLLHLIIILMGKSWFCTPEQDKYLQDQVKELLKARLDDNIKTFRIQLHETWEARWPEIDVVFPERTDTDPQLTKEQVDELSSAMASRKQVSLIPFSAVTFFILRFYP
jgi:hypothetical protein